jgi:hypothetical protein
VAEGENEKRIDFFEKKLPKSLSVQKKSITFALTFREMPFGTIKF